MDECALPEKLRKKLGLPRSISGRGVDHFFFFFLVRKSFFFFSFFFSFPFQLASQFD